MSQLQYAFGLSGMFGFYGVVTVAVYFLGDTFGASMTYRIAIIAMVLLTLPFALVGSYVARRRKKKRLAAEAEAEEQEGEVEEDGKPEKAAKRVEANQDVDKGAQEVVEFLKGSKLAASGKESVYSLPWYVVAGMPKSGKSSLILSSGLNFQSLPSQRQSEQKLVRPTREVDWRVTSEAVFVDTAGRFQTEGGDEQEWTSIMETIKKHRQKRPIDGFLLAVNTERILKSDRREIEELAKTVRTKLDETTEALKTKFPVYLVFTNADAIEGFRDSFSTSKKEAENLVWGTTIPLEKSDNAQALFDSEYEILQDSVMKRRLIRLSAPFSPTRQLRIFNFPLHFSSARRKLGTFVTTLFRPNPFSESPFLRGFYFTASPLEKSKARGKKAAIGQTVGKSYFTKKLFQDVVLRDKDLVKTFQEQRQKPPILGWLATIFGAFLTFVLLALSANSLYQNNELIKDAEAKGDRVRTILQADGTDRNPFDKSAGERRQEVVAIEDLQKVLARLDDYERNGAPWYMRFGFYSGNRILRERLMNMYYNAVSPRFAKPTENRLITELQNFSRSQESGSSDNLSADQEKILQEKFGLFQAYLMWSGAKNEAGEEVAEATLMTNALEKIWVSEAKLPPDQEETAKELLKFYFKQVDRKSEYSGDFSAFPKIEKSETIVKETRKKLLAFPNYIRHLTRITAEVSNEGTPVSVETILASESQTTITGTYPVPFAYTVDGYRKFMKEKISTADEDLGKDDWVMGEESNDAESQKVEMEKLEKRYFRDYTDHWLNLVKSAKIEEFKNADEMNSALDDLSSANSPMKKLLEEIARNTNLSDEAAKVGWMEWIRSFWSSSSSGEEADLSEVEKNFRPLFKFVGSGKEEAAGNESLPIDKYGNQMEVLAQTLDGKSKGTLEEIGKELEQPKSNEAKRINLASRTISSYLKAFGDTQAGQELTNLLRQPVVNVEALLGGGVLDRIRKDWAQKIVPLAKDIESGYPFDDQGEADMTKLKAYLNPVNGTFEQFYRGIQKYFDEKDGKLVVKESSPLKFSGEFVTYLNNARRLQKTLFAGNASPSFEYDFRLLPVKDAIVEIVIDGQNIRSEGTGSVKLKFPAAAGQSTGVVMRYTSTSEESSTSGNPIPTPTPGTNPNANVAVPPGNPGAPLSNFLQDSSVEPLRFQGTWGLFKFFDAGSPEKLPTGEYKLTYKLGDKTVEATVKPTGGDLFDKSLFRSVKAPADLGQ
ncbi:MAG: type VI secretion system membrane subunit TssM [Pyrinomonadaceae bacterium]|nr:type VI secretion system membrane subunit TssM [Pyrinomonadaceae bacterium]